MTKLTCELCHLFIQEADRPLGKEFRCVHSACWSEYEQVIEHEAALDSTNEKERENDSQMSYL